MTFVTEGLEATASRFYGSRNWLLSVKFEPTVYDFSDDKNYRNHACRSEQLETLVNVTEPHSWRKLIDLTL